MKISIITINYNNLVGLKKTAESIIVQACKDFEWIVVDGGSTDGSKEFLDSIAPYISKWVSEPDSGIYNAMNKGTLMASGDYCWYMNSGDSLFDENTIQTLNDIDFHEDIVEGIQCNNGDTSNVFVPNTDVNLSFYIYVRTNMHQASLIKRDLLLTHPYDESYRVAADKKMFVELLVVNNCSYRALMIPVCNYDIAGLSNTAKHEDERHRLFTDFFPERVLRDYEELRYLHEWPISKIYPYIFKIGHSAKILEFKLFLKRVLHKKIKQSELDLLNRKKAYKIENAIEYHTTQNRYSKRLCDLRK